MTELNRRHLIMGTLATAAVSSAGIARPRSSSFPKGFLWGAATAAHQVEGNNVNSDSWALEHVKPTMFAEPSADAANSFELWPTDLDLVRNMGLNTYRFSLEWARIEPEPGQFSVAMLDHYKAMIEGCRARGLTPVVTFNHFTTPRWFAAMNGWADPQAPSRFARFCERAARHLSADIGYAITLNEPNLAGLISVIIPSAAEVITTMDRAMSQAAARAYGVPHFLAGNALTTENLPLVAGNMLAGHRAGREAIKSVRPDLPVGVSLAIVDDQEAGPGSIRDSIRAKLYQAWLEAARGNDFVGVQNYERALWDAKGRLPTPKGVEVNGAGGEVYPASLAGAVRYAHSVSNVPVIVTEHGVNTTDDRIRARLIPAALKELKQVMDDGVPVKGYIHWSLIDNFEWMLGYGPKFGLHSFDKTTFVRTPKPSAAVLGAIARRNAI